MATRIFRGRRNLRDGVRNADLDYNFQQVGGAGSANSALSTGWYLIGDSLSISDGTPMPEYPDGVLGYNYQILEGGTDFTWDAAPGRRITTYTYAAPPATADKYNMIIHLGTNDVQPTSTEVAYKAAYQQIIDDFQADGYVVHAVLPYYAELFEPEWTDRLDLLETVRDWTREVCGLNGIVPWDFYYNSTTDLLHPDQAGHDVMRTQFWQNMQAASLAGRPVIQDATVAQGVDGAFSVAGALATATAPASAGTDTLLAYGQYGILTDSGLTVSSIGTGTGDFMADGSVQMTGTFEAVDSTGGLGGQAWNDLGIAAAAVSSYTSMTAADQPTNSAHLTRKDYVDNKTWNANDITAGTFSTSRIPNLAASKITSGRLAEARMYTAIGRVNWTASSSTIQAGDTGLSSASHSGNTYCDVTLNTSNSSYATRRIVEVTGTSGGLCFGADCISSTKIRVTAVNTILDIGEFQAGDFYITVVDI